MQCERMRAVPEQLRILLLETNHHITAYQGNTMVTLLRRYDECCVGANLTYIVQQ